MAGITAEQKDRVSKFMSAFWNDLVKPYYNPPTTQGNASDDAYWRDSISKADEIATQFGGKDDVIIRNIVYGFIRGIEAKSRDKQDTDLYKYIKTEELADMLNMLAKDMDRLKAAYKSAPRIDVAQGSIAVAEMIKKGASHE